MNPTDIPIFAMLKSRLGYLGQRERVISENVANADTPGYTPRDLRTFTFNVALGADGVRPAVTPVQTQGAHMMGKASQRIAPERRPQKQRDTVTTLDGNSVSLEDQMLKMADAKMNYDAAIGFYQKSLGLLRMAAQKPR
ncbi:flagellar basal body protein [Caulobacter sp. NIBR2454]|uniref:flagellar basal body protein n=1 Tax=Caulobacter sp. NIBR2454 TaxID=3015996 RepID=UPI0022B5F4DE|nr:flagellar basal body protein [Caulobacter sp. NIBR2454]